MDFHKLKQENNFVIKEEDHLAEYDDHHRHRHEFDSFKIDTQLSVSDHDDNNIEKTKDQLFGGASTQYNDKNFYEFLSPDININTNEFNSTFDYIPDDSMNFTTNCDSLNLNSISTKCGEIELTNGMFMFICKFCNKKFRALKHFTTHTLQVHIPTINWLPAENQLIYNEQILEDNDDNQEDEIDDEKPYTIIDNLSSLSAVMTPTVSASFSPSPSPQLHQEIIQKITEGRIKDINMRLLKEVDLKYHCPICSYSSSVSNFLQSHFKVHLIEETKNHFKCKFCNAVFARKTRYNTHVKTHTHPYKCNLCPFEFTTEEKLQEHQLFHTINKKFICKLCARAFISMNELIKHSKLQHSQNDKHIGKNIWKCHECGKVFKKKNSFDFHNLKTKHNYIDSNNDAED